MPETSPKKKDAGNGADPRYKGIDRVLKRQQYKQDALIEVLTSAQEAFGLPSRGSDDLRREAAQTAFQLGLWGSHFLSFLFPQTAGKTQRHRLSRHCLLRRTGKRDSRCNFKGIQLGSRSDYAGWRTDPDHDPLPWVLRPRAGGRVRKPGPRQRSPRNHGRQDQDGPRRRFFGCGRSARSSRGRGCDHVDVTGSFQHGLAYLQRRSAVNCPELKENTAL